MIEVDVYDILIVGGGINGAGIARDAAGRGLRVLLCEQHDLAQHTSSASTKLIHGGLRYLEYYEFGLVRKALQEREVLLRIAPHIIWPLRFVMPHVKHLRPKWMIRAGLFLYDHLARRELLPASKGITFSRHAAGIPLQKQFKRGFEYSDGWVYDARLVVLNAMDAKARGADIRTRTKVLSCERGADVWQANIQSDGGDIETVHAKTIVNAAGPWAVELLNATFKTASNYHLRNIKGSHIIVKQMFDHPYAYIFQHHDNRIIFAIPYEGEFTLIGTTDIEYEGDPAVVAIAPDEVDYLCGVMNEYFETNISPADVVSTYAGVRPLLADEHGNPSAVTRDYQLDLDTNGAPVLSIFGGKITTYRRLSQDALDKLATVLPMNIEQWTANAPLPGGDLPNASFDACLRIKTALYPWLPEALLYRYARLYGTRMDVLLAGKYSMAEMGTAITPKLYAAEIDYLVAHEWAHTADDILWRRTKLGLFASASDVVRLENYLNPNRRDRA